MNALSDVCLKDLRIRLKDKEYVPLMVGGMGVNISTAEMVLAVEKLGGIAHISDAMQMDLSDRLYGTDFTAKKVKRYYGCQKNPDKSDNHFDLNDVREASLRYVGDVMRGLFALCGRCDEPCYGQRLGISQLHGKTDL